MARSFVVHHYETVALHRGVRENKINENGGRRTLKNPLYLYTGPYSSLQRSCSSIASAVNISLRFP